ncbi:VapE domain-containing protein [Sphingopyxis sp. GW247-27LB]|uniref:VapE domain-containing protein n=1 Tax=Sphingopyxis sp. GW247-27LB TaxID=2012632 RepID=UPI000BA65DBE|nr:VapE domain-containing protein [Sphingopyxis sp. GW247-27LB]PAL23592.1 hypothetical protein CD928_05860 [Sphingopyxis sp. GW247-27LB]
MADDGQDILTTIAPFRAAGFAIHWLRPRTKKPVENRWTSIDPPTFDRLRETYNPDLNVGVRLGEPSRLVDGTYLHVIDVDIRVPQLATEAWNKLRELFPDVALDTLPCVKSGSGGASRHLYFTCSRSYRSRKIAVSEGKHRSANGKWHYDWEIEIFGTDKQVAMPPSIHPDSGERYTWKRPFDLDMLELGVSPAISTERLEKLTVAHEETYGFETREPLSYKPGQLEDELDALSDARIDDYHDWVTLGQALHHQFGGAQEGYDLWLKHSQRSEKFDAREMPRKWRSFGRNRRAPVTMASVRAWIIDQRKSEITDMLLAGSDLDDLEPSTAFDDADDESGDLDEFLASGDTDPEAKSDDDAVTEDDIKETLAALDGGADDDEPRNLDWISLLDFNEEGGLRSTLHNVELILKNDPRFEGVPQLNDFTHETVQRREPGKMFQRARAAKPVKQLQGRMWTVRDGINGDLWSDDRDFAIRSVIEAPKTQGGYSTKVTDRDLKSSIVLAADNNPFHPIKEYLESVEWDGVPRAERLFIDYLGTTDNAYNRDIARLMLIAAVTRIYEPGHKFDFAVIIEGLQGKRKSTFIQTLGRSWFAELDGDFHDQKQMVELMQGAWIMEIPELSGFNRGDVRSIKAFISRQKDRVRLAYARRAGEYPRQCIFIGSTNDREYLKDDTGGRRFWPVMCAVSEIDISALEANLDQIWAEAVTLYRQMREKQPRGILPLYLTDPMSRTIASHLQESRRVETSDDATIGIIADWLDKSIPAEGVFDAENGQPRDVTCLREIWIDCLGGRQEQYDAAKAAMVGRCMNRIPGWEKSDEQFRFKLHGKQRTYRRMGAVQMMADMLIG